MPRYPLAGILTDMRARSPSTARNRESILDVLRSWIAPGTDVLEIASGTGEHAVFLAPRLQVASWQPSDPEADARASIAAWREHENVPSVLTPLALDVTAAPWPLLTVKPSVIVCINMIHISPWRATLALFDRAAELLPPHGLVYLYGPYRREGRHTAPSNEAFDASLRSRNPEWGVRDLGEVTDAARARGLDVREVTEMPANNLSVILQRAA